MICLLRKHERAVVFRPHQPLRVRGPGFVFLLPWMERLVRVDLRVVNITVPRQEMMTRDHVPILADAVVSFRVRDPEAAIVKVENFRQASSVDAESTLRDVIGLTGLDELFAQRRRVNHQLREIIDWHTCRWGIETTIAEVGEVVVLAGGAPALAGPA